MSDMINLRSLMEPFFPGTKVTDEDWERIFGKDSGHGKIEKPLDCEGVDPGDAKGKTDSI